MATANPRTRSTSNGRDKNSNASASAASLEQAAQEASAAVREELRALQQQGGDLLKNSEQWLRQRPAVALGLAAAGGFLLSRLLRSR